MMLRSSIARAARKGLGSRAGFRSYSSYNYNYSHTGYANGLGNGASGGNYPSPRPPGSRLWKYFAGLGLLVGTGGLLYEIYWPKHTFPTSVAKMLRKGLWAESDKGENDYQLALKHYIEALNECQKLKVNVLSDEYTGIQLKIGEMYERLNMLEQANFIYNEIASLYLKVLTADDKADKTQKPVPENVKNHLIQKDLRIVVKLVELNRSNLNLCKAILFTHSIIPGLQVDKCLGQPLVGLDLNTISPQNNPYLEKLQTLSFIDEYINVMELMIAINISLGDYAVSTGLNLRLHKLMLLSNASLEKVLINQCNLGSLMYLQNEQFELNLINLFKNHHLDYSNVNFNKLPPLPAEDHPYADKLTAPEDVDAFNVNLYNCQQTLMLSIQAYEYVLRLANNWIKLANITSHTTTPPKSSLKFGFVFGGSNSDEETKNPHSHVTLSPEDIDKITEIISLSTYSLGVANLHLQNFDKAERYLREARVKSKSCNYQELIGEIERELDKVFKERKKHEVAYDVS